MLLQPGNLSRDEEMVMDGKYFPFVTGAPFPLTEEQQRRYDEPFVKATIVIDDYGECVVETEGLILGDYAVIETPFIGVVRFWNGVQLGRNHKTLEFAKATARALHTYWPDLELLAATYLGYARFSVYVHKCEDMSRQVEVQGLFDKEGRPVNQVHYVWKMFAPAGFKWTGVLNEVRVVKTMYIGKMPMSDVFAATYPQPACELLVNQLSESERGHLGDGYAYFEGEPILPIPLEWNRR